MGGGCDGGGGGVPAELLPCASCFTLMGSCDRNDACCADSSGPTGTPSSQMSTPLRQGLKAAEMPIELVAKHQIMSGIKSRQDRLLRHSTAHAVWQHEEHGLAQNIQKTPFVT